MGIKKELCTSQVISYYDPDPNTETILQCDASTLGLGARIRQIDSKGEEKIVGMASRCLTPTKSRYSNIERECLAVLFGLKKFEYYLLGRKVLVETDHSSLEQIFKKYSTSQEEQYQLLMLYQEYASNLQKGRLQMKPLKFTSSTLLQA